MKGPCLVRAVLRASYKLDKKSSYIVFLKDDFGRSPAQSNQNFMYIWFKLLSHLHFFALNRKGRYATEVLRPMNKNRSRLNESRL